MKARIQWIDGLKGLASLFIFIHHFMLAFYPAFYYGKTATSHFFNLDTYLADSPILFFINGHFLVCVFLILSGIILSIKASTITTFKSLFITIIKRYFRLSIPLFIVSTLVFIMIRLNLFYNIQLANITGSPWLKLFYNSSPKISDLFLTSFISVWIKGNDTFSTAFWMLYLLFQGSILVTIIKFILNNSKIKKTIVYVSLIVYFIYTKSLLLNFVFGMMIADLIQDNKIQKNAYLSAFFISLAIYFGAYPTSLTPTIYYRFIQSLNPYISNQNFIHTLASAFLILSLIYGSKLIHFLSNQTFLNVGTLSYSIYLIHIPILFSISSYLFIKIYPIVMNYQLSTLIVFLITIFILFITSFYFYKLFNKIKTKIPFYSEL